MRFQVLWKILYLILMELGIRSLIIHEDGTEYQSDSDSPEDGEEEGHESDPEIEEIDVQEPDAELNPSSVPSATSSGSHNSDVSVTVSAAMDSPPVVEPPVIFDTLDDQNEEVTGVVAEESVDEDDASAMYNPFDRPPNELVTQVSPLSPQQRASNKRRRLG